MRNSNHLSIAAALLLLLSACSAPSRRDVQPAPQVVQAETSAEGEIGIQPAPTELDGGEASATPLRKRIVEAALLQLGRPYRYGGNQPAGFDCSGLVQYAYSEAGLVVPRGAGDQLQTGKRVKLDDIQPGDLLFYHFGRRRTDVHVGLYVGDGRMIHAPTTGREVSLVRITEPQWMKRYVDAVKVLQ